MWFRRPWEPVDNFATLRAAIEFRHNAELARKNLHIDRLSSEIIAYETMRRRAAEVEPRAKVVDNNARELLHVANAVAWREKAMMDERSAMGSRTMAEARRLAQQALAEGRFYWLDESAS